MKIKIETQVNSNLQTVFKAFDEMLFMKLSPPFPPVKLLRFDGCKKNDEVHLQLSFIFFSQKWISIITDTNTSANEIYFIDEGKQLPFFLSSWKHKHLLQKSGTSTVIIDNINYSTGTIFTDFLIYPLMYLQFLYRKPIYKKYFSK